MTAVSEKKIASSQMPSFPHRRKQRTLKHSVCFSGISLFTGIQTNLRLMPAPADHGIVFLRTDLSEKHPIKAHIDNVQSTPRCTILGNKDVSIQTVEHLLAALSAYGIDNVLIEVDSPEIPIGDGSSAPFCALLDEAGLQEQEQEIPIYKLKKPLYFSKGDIHLIALPSDEFRVSYSLDYPHSSFLRSQYYSVHINQNNFKNEIASSRTFSLFEEIEPMIAKGIIKGGSLDNGVIIKGMEVLNPGGLRYPNEMVRHKILDVVGDLSLIGAPICAHIVAVRSGHATNSEFTKMLLNHFKAEYNFKMPSSSPRPPVVLDVKQIIRILPHRYPILLVDRIVYMNLEENVIIGQKNVTVNEHFFQGHFPDVPIMPGVLILEALAQTGGILVHQKGHNEKIAVLLNINNAKFRRPVVPGDVLMLHATGLHISQKAGKVLAKATVNDQLAVEAEIGFALVDKEQL